MSIPAGFPLSEHGVVRCWSGGCCEAEGGLLGVSMPVRPAPRHDSGPGGQAHLRGPENDGGEGRCPAQAVSGVDRMGTQRTVLSYVLWYTLLKEKNLKKKRLSKTWEVHVGFCFLMIQNIPNLPVG